jgi:hypothetical protein
LPAFIAGFFAARQTSPYGYIGHFLNSLMFYFEKVGTPNAKYFSKIKTCQKNNTLNTQGK